MEVLFRAVRKDGMQLSITTVQGSTAYQVNCLPPLAAEMECVQFAHLEQAMQIVTSMMEAPLVTH